MGFLARRFTNLLLNQGNLDLRIRELQLAHCAELRESHSLLPLFLSTFDDERVSELDLDSYRAATLFLAAWIVTRGLRKERQWRRKRRMLYSSEEGRDKQPQQQSGRRSCWKQLSSVEVALRLASVSLCLSAALLILSNQFVERMVQAAGFSEEEASWDESLGMRRELREKYLFLTSLWSALGSILIVMASAAWSFLDPRNETMETAPPTSSASANARSAATKKEKGPESKKWSSGAHHRLLAASEASAASISALSILYLSDIHLPLFHHAIRGEVHVGLSIIPPAILYYANQTLFSFMAFCIFHKLFPPAQQSFVKEANASGSGGTHKAKKFVCDPELVRRMSTLAQEARERVQARKNQKAQLRRTRSESNLTSALATPPRRRRGRKGGSTGASSLTTVSPLPALPEHRSGHSSHHHRHRDDDEEEGKSSDEDLGLLAPVPARPAVAAASSYATNSPLRDIHLAGPTLSSKDLLAKLKSNDSIKRSVSSGCLIVIPKLSEEEMSF